MKINTLLLAAFPLFALSLAASAGSITWVDRDPNTGVGPLQYLSVSGNPTYASSFDITSAGFVPGAFIIDSIIAKFAFADDDSDGTEYVDIVLGSFTAWNDLEVNGDHSNAPNSYDWHSQNVFGNLAVLGDLSADGKLNYSVTIQNVSGSSKDTYLKIAELTVTGNPKTGNVNTPRVPDGGATLGLLAIATMGIGAIRRKFMF